MFFRPSTQRLRQTAHLQSSAWSVLKAGGSHGRSTQRESPRETGLVSFIIELEFLGHIHDQHRDLGHVSRGLTPLSRRGTTLWQGNDEFEPSPASTNPDSRGYSQLHRSHRVFSTCPKTGEGEVNPLPPTDHNYFDPTNYFRPS